MNPLVLKIGLPMAILGVIAFMRWTNAKSMGEPFFPGVGDDSGKQKGGGGASLNVGGKLNSPDEVQDSGFFDDSNGSDYGTGGDDSSSDSTGEVTSSQTAFNLGGSGGLTAGHRGSVGGVVSYSPAIQNALQTRPGGNPMTTEAPQSYVPYGATSSPVTSPVANQFGGSGGGGTFAI